jgi:hypothetical protein
LYKNKTSLGGRPNIDIVIMIKMLVALKLNLLYENNNHSLGGKLIKPVYIILIVMLALIGIIGLGASLIDDYSTQEALTLDDLENISQNFTYDSTQSISGNGFVQNYDILAGTNSDGSKVIDLKVLGSGSGTYSRNSTTHVQNSTLIHVGIWTSYNWIMSEDDETHATYAESNFKFPGSFRSNVKYHWSDQTYATNHLGNIAMDSQITDATKLDKEMLATVYSPQKNYATYTDQWNSDIGCSMELNARVNGSAHVGTKLGEIDQAKGKSDVITDRNNVLLDEDYRGKFSIANMMSIKITKGTDYRTYIQDYNDYPWLPCACDTWDEMTIHDQRYHSAKDFFDCTTCLPAKSCMAT